MKKTLVFFGTYTQPILFGTGEILNGRGKGIYIYELKNGHLLEKGSVKTVNASFLVMDHTKRFLYATNELKEYEGHFGGSVSAFRFMPENNTLAALNIQPVYGADPCHIELDAEGKYLYCANFMSGSVTVLPITSNGSLAKSCCFIQHNGSSVDPKRQKGPHAHGVFFDPTGKRLFVPDLGMDTTVCYQTETDGNLTLLANKNIPVDEKGGGPRHMVFHNSGNYAYINMEMGNRVCVYQYDVEKGKSKLIQTLPTIPKDTDPLSTSTSAIKIHPNGRILYVSNRGHDSLATYRIDEVTGMLKLIEVQQTGGNIPRDFEITPDGAYLIAAHQSSDDAILFKIDPENGKISPIERIEIPTPICVRIYSFEC
jgi:6-phosphogluconolactonase